VATGLIPVPWFWIRFVIPPTSHLQQLRVFSRRLILVSGYGGLSRNGGVILHSDTSVSITLCQLNPWCCKKRVMVHGGKCLCSGSVLRFVREE